MTQATQTAAAAQDTLRHISETERGERARRAAAGALVLRVVELSAGGAPDEFTLRRARAEVERLEKSAEKSILARALRVLETGAAAGPLSAALVSYACELEKTRRLPEADAAITLALALDEGSGATALHAARLARKMGDRQRALVLYCAARDLDGGDGQIARFAQIGEAVVSDDGVRMPGGVIRRALRADHPSQPALRVVRHHRLAHGGQPRDLPVGHVQVAGGAVERQRAVALAPLAGQPRRVQRRGRGAGVQRQRHRHGRVRLGKPPRALHLAGVGDQRGGEPRVRRLALLQADENAQQDGLLGA
ncbi:MAG TPA: hypothetical protein VHG93_13855, partial [Longimicrobium sp.]|nr:hypothetical protein [Longimicrobium sp.]